MHQAVGGVQCVGNGAGASYLCSGEWDLGDDGLFQILLNCKVNCQWVVNGQWDVHGVCSFVSSRGCNTLRKPTVFTRASDYTSWMKSVSGTDKDDE